MRLLRLSIFFLALATAVFAQRGGRAGGFGGGRSGGFTHGGGAGFNRGSGGFSGGGFRSGSAFRSGSGFRGSQGFYGHPYSGSRYYGSRFYGSRYYGSRYAFSFGYGGYYSYPYFYDYGYYPYAYGYPAYSYGYYGYPSYAYYSPSYADPYYSSSPTIVQNYSQPAAPPPQDYASASGDTVYREPIYLIAFRDHRIQAAIAYWVEGDTLHIVTREHEQRAIPLADIDRAFSEQLNRDRRVEFRLPR